MRAVRAVRAVGAVGAVRALRAVGRVVVLGSNRTLFCLLFFVSSEYGSMWAVGAERMWALGVGRGR